jgi:hypothetical protein
MRFGMRVGVMSVLATLSLVEAVQAEDRAPNELTFTTDRVVVFKDGFALFVKTGSGVADTDGRVVTHSVPEGAVLGTFWASATDTKAPVSLRAEWIEQRAERARESTCITMHELLRANRGKKVTLTRTGELPEVTGTIAEVLELPAEKEPEAGVPDAGRGERVRELVPRGSQLVVLDTEKGRLVLPIADVHTCQGDALATKAERREEVTSRRKRLTCDLGSAAAGKNVAIKLLYFTEGLRWIPTYRVSGDLVDRATMELQGEIVNEAEDVTKTALDLVVGVPNFRFKKTISPLSLEQTMRSALAEAAPGLMTQSYSNASFGLRAGEWHGRGAASGEAPDGALALAPELAAAGTQDMFVYSVKDFSLPKKARATVPLWQAQAPLRHLYTMDVMVTRDAQSNTFSGRPRSGEAASSSPLKLADNPVWHQVELENKTTTPWTTGAALILSGEVPLGQELLTYTAISGRTLLPLTVAVDMCGSFQEEETGREANALGWGGHSYSLVHKKATCKVRSLKKDAAVTRVAISLGGRASVKDGVARVHVDGANPADWNHQHYSQINNHSEVTWDVTVAPGEEKTLTFDVSYYVP